MSFYVFKIISYHLSYQISVVCNNLMLYDGFSVFGLDSSLKFGGKLLCLATI